MEILCILQSADPLPADCIGPSAQKAPQDDKAALGGQMMRSIALILFLMTSGALPGLAQVQVPQRVRVSENVIGKPQSEKEK